MRPFVATIFGRATLVLPSCDGPFTWIVRAIAVVTQGALILSLGRFSSDNSPDWKKAEQETAVFVRRVPTLLNGSQVGLALIDVLGV